MENIYNDEFIFKKAFEIQEWINYHSHVEDCKCVVLRKKLEAYQKKLRTFMNDLHNEGIEYEKMGESIKQFEQEWITKNLT